MTYKNSDQCIHQTLQGLILKTQYIFYVTLKAIDFQFSNQYNTDGFQSEVTELKGDLHSIQLMIKPIDKVFFNACNASFILYDRRKHCCYVVFHLKDKGRGEVCIMNLNLKIPQIKTTLKSLQFIFKQNIIPSVQFNRHHQKLWMNSHSAGRDQKLLLENSIITLYSTKCVFSFHNELLIFLSTSYCN